MGYEPCFPTTTAPLRVFFLLFSLRLDREFVDLKKRGNKVSSSCQLEKLGTSINIPELCLALN